MGIGGKARALGRTRGRASERSTSMRVCARSCSGGMCVRAGVGRMNGTCGGSHTGNDAAARGPPRACARPISRAVGGARRPCVLTGAGRTWRACVHASVGGLSRMSSDATCRPPTACVHSGCVVPRMCASEREGGRERGSLSELSKKEKRGRTVGSAPSDLRPRLSCIVPRVH